MTRLSLATALIAGLFASLTPGRASAQYFTGYNTGYSSGYSTGNNAGFMPGIYLNNPYTGQSFNYNYTNRVFLGADYVNPYTGIRNTFYYNSVQTGALLPGLPFAASPFSGYPQVSPYSFGGYLAGGVGAYGAAGNDPSLNPVVQEQVRLLRAAGGQRGNNDVEARKLIADQWAYEQKAKKAVVPVANAGDAFQDAPEDQILSGRTINELAKAIREMEAKGARATAGLLPGDLLSRVVYAPGVPTDVIELATAGKLDFPESLSGREWITLRGDLQKAATPLLELANAGKRLPAAGSEKLAGEVVSARKAIAPLLCDSSFADATVLTRFLNRLESLAKLGTDASLQGVYVPTWGTVGAGVNEYARHLGKYGMTVAQGAPADEEAYLALYRAMLDYYSMLSVKK